MTETAKTIIDVASAFSKWVSTHVIAGGAVVTAILPMLVIVQVVHLTTEELAGLQMGVAAVVAAVTGQRVTTNIRVGERIDKEVERQMGETKVKD